VTSQQVFAAMHVPEFVEQMPDWHAVAAVPAVQPVVPSVRPHLPFVPQTSVVHSAALVALGEYAHDVVTFGPEQVFVVVLHWPERQAAVDPAPAHVALRIPSFGIATPMALSSSQDSVLRLQCFAAAQSASS
jgi:hypothetical protein